MRHFPKKNQKSFFLIFRNLFSSKQKSNRIVDAKEQSRQLTESLNNQVQSLEQAKKKQKLISNDSQTKSISKVLEVFSFLFLLLLLIMY